MTAYLGHFAALATSFAWSFTSIFFTLSGRQVGSVVVNRTRLLLAVVFVALTHWLIQSRLFPFDAGLARVGWFALSGIIGYVIGDGFLFQAFVMIGPRLSMLLMALAPVFSAMLGWGLLHETLDARELLGILLAVGGTVLVVSDRRNGHDSSAPEEKPRRYWLGVVFGLGAALGQAGGLVTSKLGLRDNFPALSGNLIRLTTAAFVIWMLTLVGGQIRSNFAALKAHPRALWAIVLGALVGPFLGVWLSLIAIQRTPLGIASTLMSLMPIILLPVGRLLFDERIGPRAIAGTVVAFAGTAILFLK
jgi:drug/metabolite transporter (DMT)-like permease